jgi:hypothetical protein
VADVLDEARAALSDGGRFHFTRTQLVSELSRRGAPAGAIERARAVALPGLVDPARHARTPEPGALANDALLYTTRRLLVCDSLDLALCLILNGFYRRFEIAIVHAGGFPEHVWSRVRRGLHDGYDMAVFTLEPLVEGARRLPERLDASFVGHPNVVLEDIGLRPEQLERTGIPLEGGRADPEWLAPLPLMRWLYNRVARGREEMGFG